MAAVTRDLRFKGIIRVTHYFLFQLMSLLTRDPTFKIFKREQENKKLAIGHRENLLMISYYTTHSYYDCQPTLIIKGQAGFSGPMFESRSSSLHFLPYCQICDPRQGPGTDQ